MKVLFVASGTSNAKPSPIVQAQINSLVKVNIVPHVFLVRKPGIIGYTKAIFQLKKHLKRNNYDIIHAHYSFSGIVAAMAGSKPLVVSLMGSDVKLKKWYFYIIRFFCRYFWDSVIVKSKDMFIDVSIEDLHIIPNGVDLNVFKPINKKVAQKNLGWCTSQQHILFASNSERKEKNFKLLKEAINILGCENIKIHALRNIPHDKVPFYLNASDIVVLLSFWEGSPNVIKEAMACNRPIVATNVGDIQWLLGNEPGLFLTNFEPNIVADNLKKALDFSAGFIKSNGRQRIIELGLDDKTVAQKIIKVYNEVLK